MDRFRDPKHIEWAKAVKERDNYRCQICFEFGLQNFDKELHSHHKNSWDWCVEERFELLNGATLCKFHHHAFHSCFNSGGNIKYQFEQFKEIMKSFRKIIKENIDR